MLRFLFLPLLLASCFDTFAQERKEMTIICIASENRDSVRNVLIQYEQEAFSEKVKTNSQGKVKLKVMVDKPLNLKIKHPYFEEQIIQLNPINYPNSRLPENFTVKLSPRIHIQPTVTVVAPGAPQIVYSSEKLSVSDFEFLPNEEILLLLYPKTLKKGGELGILNNGELVARFDTKEKPFELIHDFRNNPHIVCEKGVYGVFRTEDGVGLSTIEKDYFMKYIFPIVDTSYSKMYFTTFNKFYPAFDYKIYDQLDSSYSNILEIKDDLMMELYRSEYKWVDVRTKLWAKEMENETGIDKEVWVGANYFTQSIYYKELYAPMFVKNDTILVFDYYKDELYKFNLKGEKLDSIGIVHHYEPKKTGWQKQVIQDKKTGEIYAFFEKDGICSLRKINCQNGELEDAVQLRHRYIDKVAVYGTEAYYIYRPFESAQKKFLYKSRLR